ncbi:fimbrial protein [Alsobacter metallidurans]|uniref:Fimbrial protein n=1 Tax=Alsobacter metallidurans TaxID=340221 RepID=A0A917MJ81_9HYPH|nr:Flp family type IVb pilin [Alsobacter metallidurans]GGH25271.1 fimbrial protein [Alsobacter metallidurans]
MTSIFKSFIQNESGATAIEYGLIAGLVAVGIITALSGLRNNLSTTFNNIGSKVNACSDGTC